MAIGFRVDCLRSAFLREFPQLLAVSFGAVNYVGSEGADNIKQLDKQIETMVREGLDLQSSLRLSGEPFPANIGFHMALQRRAVFHKHSSFAAEREFRLVVGLGPAKPIEFRPSGSTLVPYVSVNIPRSSEENVSEARRVRRDFVRRVVIGPTVNPDLSAEAVKLFFQTHNPKMSVEVVTSKVPFRDW